MPWVNDTSNISIQNHAQLIAAGMGFVAHAKDVSGNNIPVGGGTYVGTATTIAGATSIPGQTQGTLPDGPAGNPRTGLSLTATAIADRIRRWAASEDRYWPMMITRVRITDAGRKALDVRGALF